MCHYKLFYSGGSDKPPRYHCYHCPTHHPPPYSLVSPGTSVWRGIFLDESQTPSVKVPCACVTERLGVFESHPQVIRHTPAETLEKKGWRMKCTKSRGLPLKNVHFRGSFIRRTPAKMAFFIRRYLWRMGMRMDLTGFL